MILLISFDNRIEPETGILNLESKREKLGVRYSPKRSWNLQSDCGNDVQFRDELGY